MESMLESTKDRRASQVPTIKLLPDTHLDFVLLACGDDKSAVLADCLRDAVSPHGIVHSAQACVGAHLQDGHLDADLVSLRETNLRVQPHGAGSDRSG